MNDSNKLFSQISMTCMFEKGHHTDQRDLNRITSRGNLKMKMMYRTINLKTFLGGCGPLNFLNFLLKHVSAFQSLLMFTHLIPEYFSSL